MKTSNLAAIEKYRSDLHNKIFQINDLEKANHCIDNIKSIETLDNVKSMTVTKSGASFRMNSIYHPIFQADTWVEYCDLKDIGKVISIFGFGNGIYIRKLVGKLDEKDIIIIYEPSIDIFMHVLEHYDIVDILMDNRLHIVIEGINELDFRKLLEINVYWSNLYSQRRYVLPQYERIFEISYENFKKIIKANNDRAVMVQNTDGLFGKIVIENSYKNMKYLNESNLLSDYIDAFDKDVPAIIVSAGPSLDKNIEQLKRINKRAVIFVVDRALEYVYQHKIEPDFAVTIDPKKPLCYFAKGYDVNVPLFTELHSNYELLDVHRGKKIFFDAFWYADSLLKNTNKQITLNAPIGKSVATAAFTICIKLGFKRIILIGQDLAYSDIGNATHAGGINTEVNNFEEIIVEGINGNKVRTRLDWYDFLIWFGDMIGQNPDIDFIDATEGGAKIKGTKIMTLSDAIDMYCIKEINVNEINRNLKPTFLPEDLEILDKEIELSKNELFTIKRKAKDAKDSCEKLISYLKYNHLLDEKSKKLVKQISKINEYICKQPIYSFINSYIVEATRESMSDIFTMANDDTDMIITFEKGREMYEQVIWASENIQQVIDLCYKKHSK